jgi:hypothetical protein
MNSNFRRPLELGIPWHLVNKDGDVLTLPALV